MAGVTNCDLSEYANQIYDPATGAADGTGRTPFAGNLIPNSRLSTQAVALLQQFPNPTSTGLINNFAAGGNGVFNNDQFNVRIDDQTTSKLHTFGRYSFANYTLTGASSLWGPGRKRIRYRWICRRFQEP